MIKKETSVLLTKICLVICSAALIGVLLWAPFGMVDRFIAFSRADLVGKAVYFYLTIYVGAFPAGALIALLMTLLHKISAGEVFSRTNTKIMRAISHVCFIGAAVALVSSLYYTPWIFVAAAAGFMGLIVRVIKNMLAEAVALKEDADLTV